MLNTFDNRPVQLLQAAPRRVKTIYSVIASPQRLEILRILNIKGPLTYSALKITSETESRLYKFQTQYLTAPLIREMVNALLVEHSLEEYRHKLTRLGMPIYDVTQLLNKVGDDGGNVESLVHMTGGAVFSEYLLLEQLPRDVADAHLAGDIHISNAGVWGLMPDTVFVDLLSVRASGFNPRGRLAYAPMLPTPENAEK